MEAKSSRRCGTVVYACCFLGFGTCFVLQAWDALSKYVEGAVTITVRRTVDPNLFYPTLALCPSHGFNRSAIEAAGLPSTQWDVWGSGEERDSFLAPADPAEADRWYRLSTHSAGDVLSSAFFFDGRTEERVSLFRHGHAGNDSVVALSEVDSFDYGRCTVLSCLLPTRTFADYLRLRVSFPSGVDEVRLESFERGLELFGIALNYWQGPVKELVLRRGDSYFVELTKTSLSLKSSSSKEAAPCAPGCDLRKRMSCFYRSSRELLEGDVCYWPVLSPWATDNDTVCANRSAVAGAVYVVNEAKFKVTASASCPPCCTSIDYGYSVRTTPTTTPADDDSVRLVIYFRDLWAEFEEEKLLYDFNNIVAAVGGSMGLFLGFSFLGMSGAFLDLFKRLWMQI